MSVQLILYPQNHLGVFNAISGNPTQAIVNGISFTNLDNTGTYTSTSGTPYVDTITNAPPTIINTWYRYRVGASAFPTVVLADLVLNSLGNGSSEPTGIYQKMSNLTIGQQYTVTINIGTQAANGSLANRFFDGLTPQGSISTFSTATSIITKNFTATNTEMTYMLAYYSTAAEDLTISSISVLPIGSTIADPTLTNGQVILDLYEDEDIPLTLSVDDFKNVAEKVQSYSKAFNLPATKRNNKIFDQLFEITRTDDGVIFNVYKKTECVLKQDGFTLFQGFLRLLDVTDKNGETSYNVNLYSEVVALADFLKDSNFRDLDFSELKNDYNYDNIRNSWQGILTVAPLPITSFANNTGVAGATTTNVLKYPFVDWEHQYTLDTSGNPVLPNLESSFRPFISIKYIINRIFEATPFTFTSTFFDTTDFEKLYMEFNKIQTSGYSSEMGYSSGVFTAQTNSQTYTMSYNVGIETTGSPWSLTHRWKWYHASTGITDYINATPMTGTTPALPLDFIDMSGNFTRILDVGDTLSFEFQSLDTPSTVIETSPFLTPSSPYSGDAVMCVTSAIATTSDIILQTLRGELRQWDFLKGLITMFNLVTLVDEDNPDK